MTFGSSRVPAAPAARAIALGALSLAVAAGGAGADVVQINPAADNTLYQDASGSLSNGAGSGMFAGTTAARLARRALTRFDVAASVPAGATIVSASLQLFQASSNTGASTIEAHRVLESWGEGSSLAAGNGGAGAPATTNDATWVHRFFPASAWSSVGGTFDPSATASQTVSGDGFYTWTSTGLAADAQAWLDAPATNFGWLFLGNENSAGTAKRFSTKEEPIAERRPVLTIEYVPVPSPGAPALACLAAALTARRRRTPLA